MDSNIIWENRSFYFDISDPITFGLVPDVSGGDPAVFDDLAVYPVTAGALNPMNGTLTDLFEDRLPDMMQVIQVLIQTLYLTTLTVLMVQEFNKLSLRLSPVSRYNLRLMKVVTLLRYVMAHLVRWVITIPFRFQHKRL